MSVKLFTVKKNTPKQGKFLKFLKLTAKPKVLENLKRSWINSWNLKSLKEYEPCMKSARGERVKGRRGSSNCPPYVPARASSKFLPSPSRRNALEEELAPWKLIESRNVFVKFRIVLLIFHFGCHWKRGFIAWLWNHLIPCCRFWIIISFTWHLITSSLLTGLSLWLAF